MAKEEKIKQEEKRQCREWWQSSPLKPEQKTLRSIALCLKRMRLPRDLVIMIISAHNNCTILCQGIIEQSRQPFLDACAQNLIKQQACEPLLTATPTPIISHSIINQNHQLVQLSSHISPACEEQPLRVKLELEPNACRLEFNLSQYKNREGLEQCIINPQDQSHTFEQACDAARVLFSLIVSIIEKKPEICLELLQALKEQHPDCEIICTSLRFEGGGHIVINKLDDREEFQSKEISLKTAVEKLVANINEILCFAANQPKKLPNAE